MAELIAAAIPPPSAEAPGWFRPVLASLLQSRRTAAVLAVVAFVQLLGTGLGLTLWPCPFLHLTGLPCPGCGLTRACVALLRGNIQQAIQLHAFAPLMLLVIGLTATTAALPERWTRPLIAVIRRVEARFGIDYLALGAIILYWLLRICYEPASIPR